MTCDFSLVVVAEYANLLEHLRQIPDPRERRGIRHTLVSLLAVAASAVLAGARSFTAIGEWIADAPTQVMTASEVRRDRLNRDPLHHHQLAHLPGRSR
ncbi:transposase family protein [Streptosporangium sp. NPDC004631]